MAHLSSSNSRCFLVLYLLTVLKDEGAELTHTIIAGRVFIVAINFMEAVADAEEAFTKGCGVVMQHLVREAKELYLNQELDSYAGANAKSINILLRSRPSLTEPCACQRLLPSPKSVVQERPEEGTSHERN